MGSRLVVGNIRKYAGIWLVEQIRASRGGLSRMSPLQEQLRNGGKGKRVCVMKHNSEPVDKDGLGV